MKSKCTILILLWLTLSLRAQEVGTIKGTVFDKISNKPLAGANVLLTGTNYGAATDNKGFFIIKNVLAGTYTIQVSFIGYGIKKQNIHLEAGATLHINFELKPHPLRLDEVKVTAIRERAETPMSINVVTEEEIEENRHVGAYDVFKQTPGIHVMQGHTIGYGLALRPAGRILIRGLGRRAGGDIRIRGIQVLIDGIPDFSQSHGHPFPDVHALDNIERIEIIKGPASVRYGNAMAGAIVMTTKTPDPGLNYYLKTSGGSWATTENMGRLSYGSKRGYIQVSGNIRHTNGHRSDAPDEFTAFNGSFKAGYDINQYFHVSLNGLAGQFEWDNPGPGGLPGGKTDWAIGDLNLNYKSKNNSASLKVWGVDGTTKFRNGLKEPITQFGIKSKTKFQYSQNSTVTFGFDWMNYDIARNDVSQGKLNEVAPYLIIEHKFSKKIYAEAGLRFTHNEQFGEDISPEFGFLYHPISQTTLRSRIAHGFRTPNAFETTFGGSANPNLDAASLWQYEIGINQVVVNRIIFDITGFIQNGDNMIRSVPDDNSPTGNRFANSGEFTHKGIEAALSIKANRNLAITATTTNLNLEDDTALAPHNIYTFSLVYTPKRLTFTLDGRLVTELYNRDNKQDKLDNYFVLDLQGSYRISRLIRGFLAIENLLDEDYEIVKGFPRPGRAVFLGFAFNRKK